MSYPGAFNASSKVGRSILGGQFFPGPILGGKVFHVFPSTNLQYNNEYFDTFPADERTTSLTKALERCKDDRGDMIVIHKGAYTQNTALTVNKGNVTIIDVGYFSDVPHSLARITYTPATAVDLFTVTQDSVRFIGLDIVADCSTAAGAVYALDSAAADKCAIIGGQVRVSDATNLCVGIDCDGADLVVKDWIFNASAAGNVVHVGIRVSDARPHISGCTITTISTSAGCRGVHLDNTATHDGHVIGNIFNMRGGTADEGIVTAAGADNNVLKDNWFHASLSDNIDDSGTGTMMVNNVEGTLIANNSATTASDTVVQD